MKILPLPDSITNLQKCYFSTKYFKEFGRYFNKYVLLRLENSGCIVQLYFKSDIHELYCYTDAAVGLCQDAITTFFYKTLDPSNIIPLDGPFDANSVHVSLTFETIEDLIEWKKRTDVQFMLCNLLKFFVIYNKCHISSKTVSEYFNIGIHSITINSIELRGKCKSHDLGKIAAKIVPSTTIMIDYELTKSMLRLNKENCAGGLEKPCNLLRETVYQNKVLKGSGMNVNKNILLIGPSGCGKKTLVRKVANDCGAFIVEINGTEIMCPKNSQGRPGEIEDNIRRLFGLIRTLCEQLILEENTSKSLNPGKKRHSLQKNCNNHRSSFVFLLLINLDLMCPNRQHSSGKRVVSQTTQLLNSIENLQELDNLLIFATTNKVDDLDSAIRRPGRLDKEIYIGIPNEEERALILEKIVPTYANKETYSSRYLKKIAKSAAALTPGRVAADLCLLCQEVMRIQSIRKLSKNLNSESVSKSWLEDFALCAAKLPVSTLLHGPGTLINYENHDSPQDQRPSLSSIAGLYSIKKRLQLSVREPLIHPEGFRNLGIRPPRGVLLYGPPGCAKTTLARALAISNPSSNKHQVEPSITFLSCSAAELYSPYVGDSEKRVMELFQRARSGAPSIIFIDELDALFGTREAMQKGGVQERVLSALLTEMDGVGHRLIAPAATVSDGDQMLIQTEKSTSFQVNHKMEVNACSDFSSLVTVIAATNRPDLIDEALLRPGRLDQLIFVPPPDEDSRYEILSYYTAKMPVNGNKESILKNLSEKTKLFSGADLKNLCKEAALHSITTEGFDVKEVKEDHFLTVLKSMRPSLAEEQILSYEKFSKIKLL